MRKFKAIVPILLSIMFLMSCGAKEGQNDMAEQYTYEDFESSIGNIIETDYSTAKNILNLVKKHEFVTCGYIVQKTETSMLGYNFYSLNLSNENGTQEIEVSVTKKAYEKVNEGDFVYAYGTLDYTDYGIDGYENNCSIDCSNGGYISPNEINSSLSIQEYISIVKEISENTYIQTNGLVMQDGENYKLYLSKDSYNENKNSYIKLEFSENQSNLNGKTITVIGKIDTYLWQGLVDCNVLE